MRITAIRAAAGRAPARPALPRRLGSGAAPELEATLVFVETDEGLTGIGSGDTMDGFERYEHLFLGQDPLDVERHARVLETIAFHAGRYWPLEAALWDLAGKAEGEPVAELLGGATERLPLYASTGAVRSPGGARRVGARGSARRASARSSSGSSREPARERGSPPSPPCARPSETRWRSWST